MRAEFEHVGMAVRDLDATLAFYHGLLGLPVILRKAMPGGRGEVAFLDAGSGGQLEIVCPAETVAGPARVVPPGEAGLRHVTFRVPDLGAAWESLMAAGVVPFEKPRDAVNREILSRVAFVLDPDGAVVELVQKA